MDPYFNRKFVSQLRLSRRYLNIPRAHSMTDIAGDHRSLGEDFPYPSSHIPPTMVQWKGNPWNLLLVKETSLSWRHPILHWTMMIGGSMMFFNGLEHLCHPKVKLVFLGWKPPEILKVVYKHPEVGEGFSRNSWILYRFPSFDLGTKKPLYFFEIALK